MPGDHPSAEVLGRLLVALQTLDVLPDSEKMGAFLQSALQEIPGVAGASLCLGARDLPAGDPGRGDGGEPGSPLSVAECCSVAGPGVRLLAIRTPHRRVGCLALTVVDEALYEAYHPFVANIGHLVATVLEGRENAVSLVQAHDRLTGFVDALEDRVGERTRELEAANEALERNELALERVSRAHAALARTNEAILRLTDSGALFDAVCRIAVEQGGYLGAWVGMKRAGADTVEIVATAGVLTREDLEEPGISIDPRSARGRGPMGTVIREGRPYYCADFTEDPATTPWHELGKRYGIRASATVPLCGNGTTVAVLTVFSGDAAIFDEQMRSLVEQMADDVTFALDGLDREAARRRAEDEVRRLNCELEQRVLERTAELERANAAVDALADSELRFRLAFEDNTAAMAFVDLEDRILAVNDSFCKLLGRSRHELLGKDPSWFTHPEDLSVTAEAHARLTSGEVDQVRYVKRYLHRDGHVIVVEVSKCPARDATGETLYFVVSERDVTEEQALTDQLAHLALHDPLTGLGNRVLFEDRLTQAHARVARQGGWGAVLLLDIDDFKAVNDTLGHFVGDQLLVALASRLEQVVRSSDTLCRFGGDEFLCLAEGLASPIEAEEIAERFRDQLSEPFFLAGEHLELHASVGVVVFEGESKDTSELIQEADVAMYEAKRQGKGRHILFTRDMHQATRLRFELVNELARARESGELSMHYQPIVDLATSVVVGFEALMRWNHPSRGAVPPDVFIPLAEQSALIFELGAFALREATHEAGFWLAGGAGGTRPYVAVNLSARQFHDPDLLSMIEGALAASGLAPQRLVLEITESVALGDVAGTARVIEHLDRLGVRVALDDFGTGYSSLAYLARLRPRIIKIDRSFVSPIEKGLYNETLLEAIVSLGQKLDLTLVAEGIETAEQLEHLRTLGCELGQGYLFSPAVPAGKVAGLLAASQRVWSQ